MSRIGRRAHAQMYGPTTGDRIRLADTALFIAIERDHAILGGEVKFGGGKVIRDGMGQSQRVHAQVADTVIFICPQQIEEALHSGITTMLGGGTGPAVGTAATCLGVAELAPFEPEAGAYGAGHHHGEHGGRPLAPVPLRQKIHRPSGVA